MSIFNNKFLRWGMLVLAVFILIVIIYISYLFISYKRIPDNQILEVENNSKNTVSISKSYTIMTSNVGFGAYSQDFTFFMDGGKESVGRSKAEVTENINGSMELVDKFSPDFILFQEVDLNSTRSYHINQYEMIKNKFSEYATVKAVNYDSAFLFYPFTKPHGKSLASTVLLSNNKVESAIRRSLPIAKDLNKFFDLDRCYSVSSFLMDNGKKLNIYNVHLSAYGGNPQIREAQMNMLFEDMNEKYKNGEYIICGGDFNHDMMGNSLKLLNKADNLEFEWTHPFPFEMLPKGFSVCNKYTENPLIPTARSCNKPYEKDQSIVYIIDGFIISDNIVCEGIKNIDNEFLFSDHNPVYMKFKFI